MELILKKSFSQVELIFSSRNLVSSNIKTHLNLAFKLFDSANTGTIPKQYLGDVLMSQADRFTQEELDSMMAAAPVDADGNLDYKGLAYIITHGQGDDEEEAAAAPAEE